MMIKTEFIDGIIELANKNEGKIFGGYLRDVILSHKIDPLLGVDFKDIDIWFTSQENADNFVENIRDNYVVKGKYGYDVEPGTVNYTFARKQYAIYLTDSYSLWVDVVVSDIFPVDDFDVNCFTYYKGGLHLEKDGLDENSILFPTGTNRVVLDEDEILISITNKIMTMLPKYKDKLMDKDYGEIHRSRVINRYLKRGWVIKDMPKDPSWWRHANDDLTMTEEKLSSSPPKSHQVKENKDPFEKTILEETDEKIVYYQGGDDRQIFNIQK